MNISELNDSFRKNGMRYLVTRGVSETFPEEVVNIIKMVQEFNDFSEDNDPYGEHDFGAIEYGGEKMFWKIDYYDLEQKMHSPDPSDPSVTSRVLTIMLSSEY